MKRINFAVFILTHRRPENVKTYETLRNNGYTGPIFLVVDNLDPTIAQYKERYGSEVVVFDKKEAAKAVDIADNFTGLKGVVYARNKCFDLARDLGVRYFLQLDDDYKDFAFRFDDLMRYKPSTVVVRDLDAVFAACLKFFVASGAKAFALSQGGDFIGGRENQNAQCVRLLRKCMNTFFFDSTRPCHFIGRSNEDVNLYVSAAARGELLCSTTQLSVTQTQTQAQAGGMTELYLDQGTYVKSFYSVMMHPSAVKVSLLRGETNTRLHHQVKWRYTAPKILSPDLRKRR